MVCRLLMLAVALAPAAARADEPPQTDDQADLVAILASQSTPSLTDMEKAARTLKAPPGASAKPLETRHGKPGSTLGIGRLGGALVDPVRYPAMYARGDDPARRRVIERSLAALTPRISACYGEPVHDGKVAQDTLGLRVVVTRQGTVAAHAILKTPELASPRLDDCLGQLLARTSFASGAAPLAVDYTWTFKLGGNASYRFDG